MTHVLQVWFGTGSLLSGLLYTVSNAAADVVKVVPPIGPSSELTHAGRPYELTLLVSTVLVLYMRLLHIAAIGAVQKSRNARLLLNVKS